MNWSEFLNTAGKWPWAPFPLRRVDEETLVASDIIALVQAGSLVIAYVANNGLAIPAMLTFGGALVLQFPLASGIAFAKFRAIWPPVGHAAAFADPEPIRDFSWFRALRGGVVSAGTTAIWLLTNSGLGAA